VIGLDAGHAVNLEAASDFNDALNGFFKRHVGR
jgi:riboflavin synthase alpha subunit